MHDTYMHSVIKSMAREWYFQVDQSACAQ